MSYPPPPPYSAPPPVPGQAPRPPRPQTVTLAAGILVAEAVLLLIGAVVSVLASDTVKTATDKYLADHNVSSTSNIGTNTAYSIIFGLVFALILVGLALGNLRGLNPVRIITWVVCGLIICCSGFGTISTAVVFGSYLPGGYLAYLYLVGLIQLIGYIAVVVLLAMRPSGQFFNPRSAQQPF